jgi:hypothetical protein
MADDYKKAPCALTPRDGRRLLKIEALRDVNGLAASVALRREKLNETVEQTAPLSPI